MDISKLHLHWRASKHKGKEYRSYSLALSYRKDGKNLKRIAVKLGKLSDDEAGKWRDLLKTIKEPNVFMTTVDDIVVTNHYSYLDIAVVNDGFNDSLIQ